MISDYDVWRQKNIKYRKLEIYPQLIRKAEIIILDDDLYFRNHRSAFGDFYITNITEMVEFLILAQQQDVTEDGVRLWFVSDGEYLRGDDDCKRVCRCIYRLLFERDYVPTENEMQYIRQKIMYQRLYDIETGKQIPEYMYRYLNLIKYMMNCKLLKRRTAL